MPQYEFLCKDCEKPFTKVLTIAEYEKEKDAMKCPECGSTKTERQWAAFFAVTSKKS